MQGAKEGVAGTYTFIGEGMRPALLFVSLLVAYQRCSRGQEIECPPIEGVPGCVCATSEGVIDLTSIANEDGKT